MSTKDIPVSAGKALSSVVKASRPPAEAPTPTTGKNALCAPPAPDRVAVRLVLGAGPALRSTALVSRPRRVLRGRRGLDFFAINSFLKIHWAHRRGPRS